MDGSDQPRFKVPNVGGFDARKVYGVKSDGPQYVDYTKRQGRSADGQVFFLTGSAWLMGVVGGSMYGLQEGLRNSAGMSARLRMTTILNATGRRGSSYSTKLGSGMFVYTMTDMIVKEIPALVGIPLEINREYGQPLLSGFCAGALYKSLRGPRAAVIAGGIGAGLSLVFSQAQAVIFNK